MFHEPLASPPRLRPDEVERLQSTIKVHCGLKIDPIKLDFSLGRAWPSLVRAGVQDASGLLRALAGPGSPVWSVLIPYLTVNETYFKREPRQLDDFVERALPLLRQRAAGRSEPHLRLLSAACSTGEEAYTLAMLLGEAGARARIEGVDIDHDALAIAEAGVYGTNSFRGVEAAWRDRHFEGVGPQTWRVRGGYREVLAFRKANLLALDHAFVGRRFDAIFCRNVLIYFERATQIDVIHQLRRLLVPGGFLFLGHSEMFFDVDLGFEVISTDRSTMYHLKEAGR